ncbi:hypothetical protein SDC9_93918 [bioreactor metagenome]|uniref:Uncharacterized protein n=1 Tax=bioreactor metagenome TaxID=1076179 RepID=A0A645A1Y3_9ZZZZ
MKSRLIEKILSAAMAALLVFTLSPWVLAADAGGKTPDTVYQLSDYVNNELLAVFRDGSTEVFSYPSEEELAAGIEALDAR